MHRMNGGTLLPVAPLFVVLLCVLTVPGQPAAASDRSSGSATTSSRDGENAGHRPYLNLGMAWVRGEGARFVDGEDTGHAALYGSEQLFDTGSIDDGLQFRLAAGVHLPHRLRAQLELGLARAFDWRGSANYRNSGEHQPSKAAWIPGSSSLPDSMISRDGNSCRAGWARPFRGRRAWYHRPPPARVRPALSRTRPSAGLPAPGSGRRDPLHRSPRGKRTELHLDVDGRDRAGDQSAVPAST